MPPPPPLCRAVTSALSDTWCSIGCNHIPPRCDVELCKCYGPPTGPLVQKIMPEMTSRVTTLVVSPPNPAHAVAWSSYCPVCGQNTKGVASCCFSGGSWNALCTTEGEYTWSRGALLCGGMPRPSSSTAVMHPERPSLSESFDSSICEVCSKASDGRPNCCAWGGSWFGHCTRHGNLTLQMGADACVNSRQSFSPPVSSVISSAPSRPLVGILVMRGNRADPAACLLPGADDVTTRIASYDTGYERIATQCCVPATHECRRCAASGTCSDSNEPSCIAGNSLLLGGGIQERTYPQAWAACEELGLQLCSSPCTGTGCGYDQHPVYTNVPCLPPRALQP